MIKKYSQRKTNRYDYWYDFSIECGVYVRMSWTTNPNKFKKARKRWRSRLGEHYKRGCIPF